jgi:hypothetical protein
MEVRAILSAALAALLAAAVPARAASFSDNFDDNDFAGWTTFGDWRAQGGTMRSASKSSNAVAGPQFCDFSYEGDVQVTDLNRKTGLLFRVTGLTGEGGAFRGYYLEVEFAGDRTRLVLWRIDAGPWVPLQSTMIYGVSLGSMMHLKVTAKGPDIWAYAKDMARPAITEHDTAYACGQVGVKNDGSPAQFDNLSATDAAGTLPPAPLVKDWSWVQGAIFYPSYALNSVNFWTEYDTSVVDREISYAKVYGLNTLSIYFNWLAWNADRPLFLKRVEDFLARADKYGLKVFPIFFDNVGNTDPQVAQLPPKPGVHNSRAMESPSWPILSGQYAANVNGIQATLKAYVQDIVNAHPDDPRILFWEVYNEPIRDNAEPVNGPAVTDALVRDGYDWVKQTGTKLPVVSTAGDFLGGKYSDFYTYHMYLYDAANAAPQCSNAWGAEGGSEHLCTETMDRPWLDLQCLAGYFRSHKTGFTFWEFMIARTQIQFPWSCNAGAPCVDGGGLPIEPFTPFHGMVFADGHPWSMEDVKTMLKTDDLGALPVFDVAYYTGNFGAQKKTGKGQSEAASITPRIDFDLPDEYGVGSPDAVAHVSANDKDDYSVRWTGKVLPPCAGNYTFSINSDNVARLWIGSTQVIDKSDNARHTVTGTITLAGTQAQDLKVEYVHLTGASHMHVSWSGPCFALQTLPGRRAGTPVSIGAGKRLNGAEGRTAAGRGGSIVAHMGGDLIALPAVKASGLKRVTLYDLSGNILGGAEVADGAARLRIPLAKGLYILRGNE